jgi:MFS family permease
MRNSSKKLKSLQVTFLFGHMANDWCHGAIYILLPAIGLTFDLRPSQLGLLVTIYAFGAALAYLPAGIIADRFQNQGRLLLLTFWWVGIGYIAASRAPGFLSLAFLLAIAGMGDATWHPIATGILTRQMPSRRGQALGVHAIGGTLATVLSPLLVGFLLAVMNWRDVMVVSAAVPLLMGLVFLWYHRAVPRSYGNRISRSDLGELRKTWTSASGLTLIAGIATYNMALIALITIMPLFLQRAGGFTTSQTGVVFALAMLIGAIGQPWVGRLSDAKGRRGVFIVGSVIGVSAAIFAALPLAQGWLSISLVLAVGALTAVRSVALALAVDFAGQREATTLGFVYLLTDGVGAFGAILAGVVGNFQLQYAFLLSAGFSIISIASIFAMGRTHHPSSLHQS